MPEPGVERIRALNDRARQSFTGCRVAITAGIAALGHEAAYAVFDLIKPYDEFTPDNDPYQEHDFGSLMVRKFDFQIAELKPTLPSSTLIQRVAFLSGRLWDKSILRKEGIDVQPICATV